MADRKQLVGYVTATLLGVVPRAREVMVDITKQTLAVGDGSTAGGFPLAREDLINVSNATDTVAGKMAPADKKQLILLGDLSGANTLTAATPTGFSAFIDGGRYRGRLITSVTGAAVNLTVAGVTKTIVGSDGLTPRLGSMLGGLWYTFTYNGTADRLEAENLALPTAVYFQALNYGLTGGTAGALTLSTAATRAGWTVSDIIGFKCHVAPSAGATLAFEGFAAKPLTINGGVALTGNEFALGSQLLARIEATNLEIIGAIGISNALAFGRHTLPINGSAFDPLTTNGATPTTISQSATNHVITTGLDFSGTVSQHAQFRTEMPKSWDAGTFTFTVTWTTISGAGDVIWRMRALALRDGVVLDTAFGSFVSVTDTAQNNKHCRTAESSAVTIANVPAKSDEVVFEISRDAANASDTHQGPATLIRVTCFLLLNAATDS